MSPSPTLGQTEALALRLRREAVVVAAAAAVPEAGAFVLLGVEEPHHGVVLAGAHVLIQEAGVWVETDHMKQLIGGLVLETSVVSPK